MSDIAPDAKILEDGDILTHDTTEAGGENTEFADLAQLGKPAADEADLTAAAAAKTAAAPATGKAAPAAAAAAPAGDDEVPAEFKGKSLKEVVKMYQDAHKVIGRQGSELGELRAKADHAIKLSLEAIRAGRKPDAPAAPAKDEPLDESELFSKPQEFLNKVLANSPVIKEIRESLGQAAAAQATSRAAASTQRFNEAHPDASDIMRDPEFRQWVSASPVRSALLRRAHSMYDFASGDEVFSTWKALKGAKQSASNAGEQPAAAAAPDAAAAVSEAAKTLAAARKAKQDAAARAAGVPTGGAAGASAGKGSKPIFRRADVLRLMETDPDRYEALSDEIRIAYEEGRVR